MLRHYTECACFLKRNSTSASEVLNYINQCHLIYKRVISEAKKNYRLVKSANNSKKVMWQLINTHMGKLHISNQDNELKTESGKITNLQTVADTLNSFYIDCTEDLIVQNKSYINGQSTQMQITYNLNINVCLPSNRRWIKPNSK